MNLKSLSSLAVIGLGLCFSAVTMSPARSSELMTDVSSEEILISQLRGHDVYDGEPQMRWDDDNYSVGRIVGGSGNMISIRVEDGTIIDADISSQVYGGVNKGGLTLSSDVLVVPDENGNYYLVEGSHSGWISYLEEDYGVKRNKNYPVPLLERTAPIWASLDY